MQGTFIGFNTAGITFEERFLALLLKVKKENGFCEIYYLQAPVLADLLLILQSRMAVMRSNTNPILKLKYGFFNVLYRRLNHSTQY